MTKHIESEQKLTDLESVGMKLGLHLSQGIDLNRYNVHVHFLFNLSGISKA